MTTGASRPWNLSTVPTWTPEGTRARTSARLTIMENGCVLLPSWRLAQKQVAGRPIVRRAVRDAVVCDPGAKSDERILQNVSIDGSVRDDRERVWHRAIRGS